MSTSKQEIQPLDPALLSEFDVSGESAAGFARRRGIAPWRFCYALDRRAGKGRKKQRGKALKPTGNQLLPVRVVPDSAVVSSASLVIELVGGHRIEIRSDFDAVLLRRVLGALEQC